jgi:predicted transcriptional regulator
MPGKNRDRETGVVSDVVKPETNAKAARAQEMRKEGNSLATIAKALKVSVSRVREYLMT